MSIITKKQYQYRATVDVGIGVQISAKVWMQMSRKGSSACSATAMTARITVSDTGTNPTPFFASKSLRTVPISTVVRMSLMTCSFSTACLLSRRSDLTKSVYAAKFDSMTHLTIYQSSESPSRLTVSASTSACLITLYAAARHCLEHRSPKQGRTLCVV